MRESSSNTHAKLGPEPSFVVPSACSNCRYRAAFVIEHRRLQAAQADGFRRCHFLGVSRGRRKRQGSPAGRQRGRGLLSCSTIVTSRHVHPHRWGVADGASPTPPAPWRSIREGGFARPSCQRFPPRCSGPPRPPIDSAWATSSSARVLRSLKLGWGSVVIV